MSYERWDIYNAYVEHEDSKKGETRPVIIISYDKIAFTVVVLKITTHKHSGKTKRIEYEISDCEKAGVEPKSFVICDKYRKISKDDVFGRRGRLSPKDISLLRQMMAYYGLGTE